MVKGYYSAKLVNTFESFIFQSTSHNHSPVVLSKSPSCSLSLFYVSNWKKQIKIIN